MTETELERLKEIKDNINSALWANYEQNERAVDDIRFALVPGSQWDASFLGGGKPLKEVLKNRPRPEINKIAAPINRLLGQKQRLEMNAKIISSSDNSTDEDADLLQSIWRNDFQSGDGNEAVNNSDFEAYFGGFGCSKIVAKFADPENPDPEKQNLSIEPVYSAASSVGFAPSLRKDKADSRFSVQLIRTSKEEIELEYGVSVSPVNSMQHQFINWNTNTDKDLYLAHYWEVVLKTITIYDFGDFKVTKDKGLTDGFGNKVKKEDLDSLLAVNPHKIIKKKLKKVLYSLVAGDQLLIKDQIKPFKRQPLIPQYGYHFVLDGIENYCGEVARRRDPQMFYNTYVSGLAQIAAADQVSKPEYTPEQINKHKTQRTRADSNNLPYTLSDPILNAAGDFQHAGPIHVSQPPQLGTGLAAMGQTMDSAMMEMGGMGSSTVPSNASADAIAQVNERQDDAFQSLMQNSMHALKAMCETWLPAAQKLYFSNQRKVRALSSDGSHSQVETLQFELKDGEFGATKNSARGSYSVSVKTGESYKSQREAEHNTIIKMLPFVDSSTPQGQMMINQAIISTSGEGGARARKIANFQIIDSMLVMGVNPNPETDEEKQYMEQKMQQMQQPKSDPDAIMVAALAEQSKADAANKAQDNKAREISIQEKRLALEHDKIKLNLMLADEKQEADIANTQADTTKKQAETRKIIESG